MARLTFLGAAGTVTGSRFLVEGVGGTTLIDCGLFQGSKENRLRNREPFPFPVQSIDRALITHAHIDHTGYLPRIVKDGFNGPIHCTDATAALCDILLRDSAHLQVEDAKWANEQGFSKHSPALPLYDIEDAERALGLFKPVHYGEELRLDENTRVKFKDSGHILGSAFIDIRTRANGAPRKIVFSGDFGRAAQPVLREPVPVYDVDYLVLESTYGDRLHDPVSPVDELARIINDSVDRGGVLLIPSFAVGRTQTLLYVIRELEEAGHIPNLPVYLDSPMSLRAGEVFDASIGDLSLTARVDSLEGKKLFRPKRLTTALSRVDSQAINIVRNRAIIISSSGMATGGRILHHLARRLPDPATTVLFIGYQAEETRGRTILDSGKTVKIHGADIPIKATIESITGFSGHGDYNEILGWLMGFNRAPERTFIVHGEPAASKSLAEKIRAKFGWDVHIPVLGETAELAM